MEEKKKHIEIRIKMDENEQITPNSKISNVSGDDVIACYLAGAVYVANIVADCSNGKHGAKHKGIFTKDRAKNRSKTFLGIAQAMAQQWGVKTEKTPAPAATGNGGMGK